MGYKAGMTTIVRDLDRPGAKSHRKEVVEESPKLLPDDHKNLANCFAGGYSY